jgi:hypothetical protein
MTGVTLTTTSQGPTTQAVQFLNYEARCTCGWRLRTDHRSEAHDVRETARAHADLCLG